MAPESADDSSAWALTMAELQELEVSLEEEGWDVVAIPAGHVAPVSPQANDTGRYGLVHVIPGDEAAAFESAFETGTFAEYEVFRRQVGNRLFLLTKLTAPEERTAILLAGNIDLTQADQLIEAAASRGEMYTHVQLLDGSHLGSFEHGDPSLFFPSLEDKTG